MVARPSNAPNYLADVTASMEPVLPTADQNRNTAQKFASPPPPPLNTYSSTNIFEQIDNNQNPTAVSPEQLQQLQQDLRKANDKIAVSATYGFRDANGGFHRLTPEAFHPMVESVLSDEIGRYRSYVILLDPAGDVQRGNAGKIETNNRAVAQLLGLETRNLDDDAINNKLGEISNSRSFSAVQPDGASLKATYTRPDGSSGEFFIPLTPMNPSSFGWRMIVGISANGGLSLGTEAQYSTPLVQDRRMSQGIRLGIKAGVSEGNLGITGSTILRTDQIDPDMQQVNSVTLGAGAGLTTTGPQASVTYANQQTDLLTGKTQNVFSGKIGVSPFAGPFVDVDADLGTVNMSAGVNVLPFAHTPFPGAVSLIFTDKGEKSYELVNKARTHLVITQGTNGLSRGSIGLGGILPIVIPLAIPGPGLMPVTQTQLPVENSQALKVGDISDALLGMNNRATDGNFSKIFNLAAPVYTQVFGSPIQLPGATMAVNVLPQRELNSGRYDTIVKNAEKELGIKIVENGAVVASREEIHEAVLKYVRNNNPGLNNPAYFNVLRTKCPELSQLSDDTIRKSIEKYAMVAVEKAKVPTAAELWAKGMPTSTMIPHVDDFTLKAEPRVELVTGKDGQKYIVAQVAINVGLIDKQKTEQSRANGSIDTFQDDRWVVSEQVVRVDPNRNLREQIESAATQVEKNTGMYLQRAYEELDSAANRRLDLNGTREERLKAFQNLGFSRIQNKQETGERWNQRISAINAVQPSK